MIGMELYRYTEYVSDLFGGGIELITSRVVREDGRFYYAVIDLDDMGETSKEIKVSKKARNRLAWPTKVEAYNSYVARKHAQIKIAESMIKAARYGLSRLHEVNQGLLKDNHPDLRLCDCGRLVSETDTQWCVECERAGCDYCIRREDIADPEVGWADDEFCYPNCQEYES
jgi:hypothetical protein